MSAGALDQWIIYPSELDLIEENYPLLVLAKGKKLEQFMDLCIERELHDYLHLTLRIGSLNDPGLIWQEILKVKHMRQAIKEETWSIINQFFDETPEGFGKVKSFQEALLKKQQESRQEGRQENARSTLIRLLGKKFGEIPQTIITTIKQTKDLNRLEYWLDQVVIVSQLEDIDFK